MLGGIINNIYILTYDMMEFYSEDIQNSITTVEIVFSIDEYITKTHTMREKLFRGFEDNHE